MRRRMLDQAAYDYIRAQLSAHQAAIFMLTMGLNAEQKEAAANQLVELGKYAPRRSSHQFRRTYKRELEEFAMALRGQIERGSDNAQGT